ncbi:MAG: FliH/SctL family protein [Acidobacteriota bacterium]
MSKATLLEGPAENTHSIQEFVYRGVEAASPSGEEGLNRLPSNSEWLWNEPGPPVKNSPAEPENNGSEEDLKVLEQKAWQEGFDEATARAREDLEKALAEERNRLAKALSEFAERREEYFRNVEGDAVRLVLAIARKVLHREAQVDPLLLTGVVRVALDKIANGTTLKLRVPAIQANDWRDALSSLPDLDSGVEIVGDKSLTGPECLIVTETGTTDLSLEAQLAEIERGFLDLLSQRPGDAPVEIEAPSYAA